MQISAPKVSITIIPATNNISNSPQKVLFVGQMKTGTATAGALTVGVGNSGQENALFGATSMLAQMIRRFRKINPITQVDAIALADNSGGTAATGTIVITGPATAAGTLQVAIGSSRNYTFSVAVAVSDTATTVGTALAAAINAVTDAPFTAGNSSGTVTITSVHKGTFGNKVAYKVLGIVPAGLAVALTAPVNGATNPSLTNIFNVITGERYQTIVWPEGYTTSTLVTELDSRFNFTNKILDGVGIQCLQDTYANQLTALAALNSPSMVIQENKLIASATNSGGMLCEFDDVISAEFAAVRSLRLTPNADISQLVISTNGALDSIGGPAIASLPYFNTPMVYLDLVDRGLGYTQIEIDGLNTAGGSTLGNNTTASQVILGDVCTTSKTDAAGNAQSTYKFLNAVDTASNVREYFYNNLKARFAQSRLTTGDVVANRTMANATVIAAYLDKLYSDLSGSNFVLTQSGVAAQTYFKNNRTVTLDLVSGTATITMETPIVTQLRSLIVTMQISFSTQG